MMCQCLASGEDSGQALKHHCATLSILIGRQCQVRGFSESCCEAGITHYLTVSTGASGQEHID